MREFVIPFLVLAFANRDSMERNVPIVRFLLVLICYIFHDEYSLRFKVYEKLMNKIRTLNKIDNTVYVSE